MRDINLLIRELWEHIDNPEIGLPYELFNFITKLTPMVNVDLLIKDKHGKYLLSWRNDDHGNGWHVPGGIVRVKETLIERVERTSLKEIGCLVNYNPKPVNFAELVYLQTEIRPHFYSFLFDCMIPENFDIGKQPYKPGEMGHLAWHTKFPHDMIPVHKMYKKFFTETENGKFQI